MTRQNEITRGFIPSMQSLTLHLTTREIAFAIELISICEGCGKYTSFSSICGLVRLADRPTSAPHTVSHSRICLCRPLELTRDVKDLGIHP
jgi:hypothetical protein